MTLAQMIAVLNTKNATVTVIDASTSAEIIVFKASGISGVETDVSGRTVSYWEITSATAVKVALAAGA